MSTDNDAASASPTPPDTTSTNASPELEDMVRSIHAIGERGTGRDTGDDADGNATEGAAHE
ncbi:hypothetical protein [Marisediminicola sp. LYQ134]|uniref:hypothetical protein n=1 Tax=unclassified Marisediminicola TaxID=2618316 RepID=UPI00398329DC